MNQVGTPPEAAVAQAAALLREQLPESGAAEAWTNETVLEYRRLCILREQGSSEAPREGSLLSRFLAFAPEPHPARVSSDAAPSYLTVFGHRPPYNWTLDMAELNRIGPEGGVPGMGAGIGR